MDIDTEKSCHDRRRQVIDITTELFLENGFSGTSMSAIAKACGITKASLYHHFAGKDDLFIACVTDGYGEALHELRVIADDANRSPAEKLTAAVDTLYETCTASSVGRMSPLIAEVSRSFPKVAASFYDDYITPQQEMLWRIVEEGQAAGAFGPIDNQHLLHLTFGPIVTLSLSREMFASFQDLDERFPVEKLQASHTKTLLEMLEP